MTLTHFIGFCLITAGVLAGAVVLLERLERRVIRREERRQQDAFLPDTQLLAAQPWDGATFAYPQSWEWPQDQTIAQFLDGAAVTAEQPVIGIRTSGPFPVLDAIEDTEAWIAKMRRDSDAVIARLCAPLAETAWR